MDSPDYIVANVGVVSNASLPLFKVNSGFGGITVLGVHVTMLTAGTAGLYLVDMGTAGTAVSGTIASYGGTAYAAKTPGTAFTVGTPYVSAGHWVGIKEDNTGTTVTVTQVAIDYADGK